jgi:GNAT superfamily N-acetyltransferase
MTEKTIDVASPIHLRPVKIPDDEDFLKELYFSIREDLKLLPLAEPQKQAFITMQFSAQKQHYAIQFAEANHEVILLNGNPVGRLLVNRGSNAIYLVDISLLAEHRGTGIGTAILNDLVAEAENTKAILSLHVMKTNPAARLYLRMGLTVTADDGLYLEMQKLPTADTQIDEQERN